MRLFSVPPMPRTMQTITEFAELDWISLANKGHLLETYEISEEQIKCLQNLVSSIDPQTGIFSPISYETLATCRSLVRG